MNPLLPLEQRLLAFEWLADHREFGGAIRAIELELSKAVAEAGGQVIAGRIGYRAETDGRLFRFWAP